MKVADSAASSQVFVPSIGFRPGSTRTLVERAEVTEEGTRLIVLAVAAAPVKTEVLVEWERKGEPVSCAPGSQLLVYTNRAPLEKGVGAELVVGATTLHANAMAQRSFSISHQTIAAIHTITFPPLPETADGAELVVIDNGQEWRVPVTLGPARVIGAPLDAKVERDGIVIRAIALARHEGDVIVELEVEAAQQIRQVGAPLPMPARYASLSDDDHRTRVREHHRVLGHLVHGITLEDGRGGRHEEIRRLLDFEPQRASPGRPFVSRFAVVFKMASTEAKSGTLLVPFVDLSDPGGSVTADLSNVPVDLELGTHHFHVQSAEPIATDWRKVIVEGKPSPGSPRFRHPGSMHGSEPSEASWPRPGLGEQIAFDAAVGDPPMVTFKGAVLRVDGPMRLDIPLV